MYKFENLKINTLDDKNSISEYKIVNIRKNQRNRRKCVTTIEGLADDLDLKKICKFFKKNFNCNGSIVKDEEYGNIIQLQGDLRVSVKNFLISQEIIDKNKINIHGE
tara:strand:+ start:3578 stop:3898 length:321 start_codon:yes stop_codon:yes gene_type:complete